MTDKNTGLVQKFNVTRVDGRDAPGGDREGAEYFVLDYVHDPIARAALHSVADVYRQEGFTALADDLDEKWRNGWLSMTDPMTPQPTPPDDQMTPAEYGAAVGVPGPYRDDWPEPAQPEAEDLLSRVRDAFYEETVDPADGPPEEAVSAAMERAFRRVVGLIEREKGEAVAAKNAAYQERDRLVAAFAHLAWRHGVHVGVGEHEGEDWEDDWRTVIYLDLPAGQVSWHVHESERLWFDGLPPYDGGWDGHDTDEKYRRLAAFGERAR